MPDQVVSVIPAAVWCPAQKRNFVDKQVAPDQVKPVDSAAVWCPAQIEVLLLYKSRQITPN